MIQTTKYDFTELYNLGSKLVTFYQQELEAQKVNTSGNLSKNADFDVDFRADGFTLYMSLLSYFYYVEYGRGRSTGNNGVWNDKYRDIERWLRDKIARGSFLPRGSHPIPRTDKEIRRAAGAIVHKITHFGYYDRDSRGKHILKNIIDRADREGLIDKVLDSLFNQFDNQINAEIEKL